MSNFRAVTPFGDWLRMALLVIGSLQELLSSRRVVDLGMLPLWVRGSSFSCLVKR